MLSGIVIAQTGTNLVHALVIIIHELSDTAWHFNALFLIPMLREIVKELPEKVKMIVESIGVVLLTCT
jgi:hypothetical protein